ncbi:MAG TPA: hypothetical protein O0X01_07220, partial [Methanocorpusculum sp.]|nr:hypothetical protein [Methanocorpusculum sp.]
MMKQKTDSGLSIAVGFVMILMIIGIVIGMWAVVGVPEQIKDAENYHSIEMANSFLDYKIAVDNQRDPRWVGSKFSVLIPAASAYADGALFMKKNVGTLTVLNGTTVKNSSTISRLYATFGTTNTLVGYEGGGVFRNDHGYATWVTPPSITLAKDGFNMLYVTVVVPSMNGSFEVGSSEGIPVETGLNSTNTSSYSYISPPIKISYTANDIWDAKMWSTFFNE